VYRGESQAAATLVHTIQFSLNETARVRDVTMTLLDDVIANNLTIYQAVSQVIYVVVKYVIIHSIQY